MVLTFSATFCEGAREDYRALPYCIAKTRMPLESDETWLAILEHDDQKDPVQEIRRIKGKMAVKHLGMEENEKRYESEEALEVKSWKREGLCHQMSFR